MPIKKDADGKRWVEMEFVTPGTPEDVWQAMATGAGPAWFTNAAIDERVGGTVRFDFGPAGSTAGEVTTWEPPHRFGYVERDWCPGAPPVATEITITGRAGSQCVVRMVRQSVQQDGTLRTVTLRLETPAPGVAVFGTFAAASQLRSCGKAS